MIPARWFGQPWDAPICRESSPLPVPAGEICPYCDRLISATDRGIVMPYAKPLEPSLLRPLHLACVSKLSEVMPADEIDRLLPEEA